MAAREAGGVRARIAIRPPDPQPAARTSSVGRCTLRRAATCGFYSRAALTRTRAMRTSLAQFREYIYVIVQAQQMLSADTHRAICSAISRYGGAAPRPPAVRPYHCAIARSLRYNTNYLCICLLMRSSVPDVCCAVLCRSCARRSCAV